MSEVLVCFSADAVEVVERKADGEGGVMYYVHYSECERLAGPDCWLVHNNARLHVLPLVWGRGPAPLCAAGPPRARSCRERAASSCSWASVLSWPLLLAICPPAVDKRLDEWVPADRLQRLPQSTSGEGLTRLTSGASTAS